MSDAVDRAAIETEAWLAECIYRQRKPVEIPDEDEGGRYCLSCGITIDPRRVEKAPEAVRCVSCESIREEKNHGRRG
ncbi:TraR/DksA family transcriptional regulator [Photobacterium atrarenae]|uniref:TraR/DksA family transcriptional regulator n=1 Tax=Photobacterium atrarenae TaxID=865757 RepID=A0ABY5GM45_9GAMM|nr:TraR/DksA family transcriptional regulator [Photobacterium atrarenae]UTV30179.1 TraR/DksA family transcriptional regulator [Photobacterium atrarenae]